MKYLSVIFRTVIKIALVGAILFAFWSYKPFAADNYSQTDQTTQIQTLINYNFIRRIAPLAQAQQTKYGIFASITLAQACLESDFGQSTLASKYHNLFGVKSGGADPQVSLPTQEYENDKWVTIAAYFRVYPSDEASVEAHSELFVNGTTWNPQQYEAVLTAKDYKKAALALQTSGYATDPAYSAKILQLIESYQLKLYDK